MGGAAGLNSEMISGVAAALRNEVEELRKVEAEVEQLRKRRDLGKVEEAKRRKRSCSVGQRESLTGVHTRSQDGGSPAGHKMAQKTWLKSEKCGVCAKRMKFGKIGLRCIVCKLSLHTDCAPGVSGLCLGPTATPSSPTLVSRTPARSPDHAGRTRTRAPLFASPMLR